MHCRVKGIKRNFRYRILTINNEHYILDMGQSFWRFLFPVFSWIFPHTVYKVNKEESSEKLEAFSNPEEKSKQKNTGELSFIVGALGVPLGSLLYSFLDTSLFSNSFYMNMIVVTIPCLFIVFFMIYLNMKFKKNFKRIIHIQDYPTVKLWIRPQSLKFMLTIIFYFVVFLTLSIVMFYSYIREPNTMALILGTVMFFATALFCYSAVTRGDYVVKFEK